MKYIYDKLLKKKVYVYSAGEQSGAEDKYATIYNLKEKGGAYSCNLGTRSELPLAVTSFKNLHYFRHTNAVTGLKDDIIIGRNADNKIAYFHSDDSGVNVVVKSEPIFTEEPKFINYNYNGADYLVINGKSAGFYVFDGIDFDLVSDNPHVTGAAIYDNKLFACSTENYPRVKYMRLSSPDSWTVTFTSLLVYNECGMVKSLATMGSSIYVFQENGISKITKADTDDYAVSKIYECDEAIFGDTVKVCGDKIYFCTNGGAYSFDGSRVKQAFALPKGSYLPSEQARTEFFGGKIYAALRLKLPGDAYSLPQAGNNSLVVYDPFEDKTDIYTGMSISSFCAVTENSRLLISFSDNTVGFLCEDNKFNGQSLRGYYGIEETDLGRNGKKFVLKTRFSCNSDAVVKIKIDGQTYSYAAKGDTRPQEIRVGKGGERIGFSIESEGGVVVPPTIYFTSEE